MSCFFDATTPIQQKTATVLGTDVNPFLTILFTRNTPDGCAPVQTPSGVPSASSRNASQARNPSKSEKRPYNHTGIQKLSPVIGKDVTARLDRLEVELRKIVRSITRDPERLRTSSTDAEEGLTEELPTGYPPRRECLLKKSAVVTTSVTNRPSLRRVSEIKLIPPECFERPRKCGPKSDRSGSCVAGGHDLEEVLRLGNELRDERHRREGSEAKLDQMITECNRLRSEITRLERTKTESDSERRFAQLGALLSDERNEKERLEICLNSEKSTSVTLTAKLESLQSKLCQMQERLQQKENLLSTLSGAQKESGTLREKIQELEKELRKCNTKVEVDSVCARQETRKAVDNALKKATTKFTKFHTEEMRCLQAQLLISHEGMKALEARFQDVSSQYEEIQKLQNKCCEVERELSVTKSGEEVSNKKVDELTHLLDQSSRRADDLCREKTEETEKSQKTINGLLKECAHMHQLKNATKKRAVSCLMSSAESPEKRTEQLKHQMDSLQNSLKQAKKRSDVGAELQRAERETCAQNDQYQREVQLREEEIYKLKKELCLQADVTEVKEKMVADLQNTVQNLKRIPDPVPTCKQAYSPDLEHLRRRNRELEQILDRVEKQTEDLKSQLAATETQLQKSDRDNEITNAKWVREKEAYMSRLQSGFETYRARSEVREEELQRERDDALSLVDALESKLEQTNVKTQQLQHMDLRIMLSKYEQELSKKDTTILQTEYPMQNLEKQVKTLITKLDAQKNHLKGKFSKLGRLLNDFECDL